MANTLLIQPTLTKAGQQAAFALHDVGLELVLTHMTYGDAFYAPTGNEVALASPVSGNVMLVGGGRPTIGQIRAISVWDEDTGGSAISEVGWWAGDVLAFVWSNDQNKVLAYKTDGVPYVMHSDLALTGVPTGSVNVIVDTTSAPALAALGAHEVSPDAHPQYVLWATFPDAMSYLWAKTVAGTANNIALTMGNGIVVTQYNLAQQVRFKALANNSGPVTVSINGVAPANVLKMGGEALAPNDIKTGGIYDLVCDGISYQLMGAASVTGLSGALDQLTDAFLEHVEDDTADPHTQYAKKSALSTHLADPEAHPQYMKANSGLVGLALFNQGIY